MIKVLILADDFTGALDTGVQFSNYGVRTKVTSDINVELARADHEAEVLVINTETRYLSNEKAYQVIKEIALKAKEEKVEYIYKKVDSALRGNVPAEVKAISDVFNKRTIPFTPAYPEQNRYSDEGILLIDTVPVSQSVFGQDPYEPVTESHIPTLLESVNLSTYVSNEVTDIQDDILLLENHTYEDMQRVADELHSSNKLNVTIGCAGFAKILAGTIFNEKSSEDISIELPLVVICGSVNPVTKKQIAFAQESGFERISLTSKQLLQESYWSTRSGKNDILNYLKIQQPLMFETFEKVTKEFAESKDISTDELRFQIGKSLGYLVRNLMECGLNRTVLFTGGDTLFQSMNVLGINEIEPVKELFPGVVLASIQVDNRQYSVITKSGGFGDEDLFVRLSEFVNKKGDSNHVKTV